MAEAISDEALARTMSRFAGMAARILDEPGDWLDGDNDVGHTAPGPASRAAIEATGLRSRIGRLGRGLRSRFAGDVHPGSPQWSALPVQARSTWWVNRVAAVAAPIAATPRVFGIAADRLPIQAALGAAAAGLAVCAVAREHGVTDPDAWVPLLGRVLLDRDLRWGNTEEALAAPEPPAEAELPLPEALEPPEPPEPSGESDLPEPDSQTERPDPAGRLRRGTRALWRLARTLLAVPGIFEERPRGALIFRAIGKLPIVGLAGGVLDERGAVHRAAAETTTLLAASR